MKKICVMILAAAMLLSLCACNIKDVTKVITVGNESISKGEFNFYLQQAKNETVSKAQQDGQVLTMQSPAELWDTVMIDGKTAKQYAIDLAKDNAKEVLVLKAKAIEEGMSLTEEDKQTIKEGRQSIINNYGGRYEYEQAFSEAGFTLEDVENIITDSVYGQKIIDKYIGTDDKKAEEASDTEETADAAEAADGGETVEAEEKEDGEAADAEENGDVEENTEPEEVENSDKITVSDEQAIEYYNNDYVYVKHILISNTKKEEAAAEEVTEDAEAADTEAEAPADEETAESAEDLDAKAKAKAEDIIKQIEGGADFDKLMAENSDDGRDSETGELTSPDGYVFKKGDGMAAEFEEAAFALEVGGLTKEPVKTQFGYHIIERLELPQSGKLYDEAIEKAKDSALSDIWDSMIEKWAEELGVSFNDRAISKIKF